MFKPRASMKVSTVCKVASVAAVLLITACANQPATFVPAPAQPELGSVIYIYRPASSSNFLYSPRVIVDDNEKFSIGSGDYRYVYLQAGEHTVGLNPTDQYATDAATRLTIETDRSYYLRVGTLLEFKTDGMNTREFWIDVVDEHTALSEIGKTQYAGPKPRQTATVQSDPDRDRQGFSVDKTQDPFAGKYQ